MSLYADYLLERTTDHIMETEWGFATYRFLNDNKSVYIIDIYTDPDHRNKGEGTALADAVVDEAKVLGCTELLGTVVPSTKGSTTSVAVLIGYGMKLLRAEKDLIVLRKDI